MDTARRVIKNPLGAVGITLVLFWVIVALLAPIISPPDALARDPYMIKRIGFNTIPQNPSPVSPLGTTGGGYSIYYGIVWGSRTAFKVGLLVVGAASLIGVIVGGVGGFLGGWIDNLAMRITDLFMCFPFLIAVIVMSSVLGKGLDKVIVALIVFGWRRYARVMRGQVLTVKAQDFVSAAESLGASRSRIFLRHILPNAIFPVFVLASMDIGLMVMIAASLSFLGVGAEMGYADWGQMVNFARGWLLGSPGEPFRFWFTYAYPFLAILTFVLGWTLLGDTLRDVLDPKIKKIQ